MNKYENDVLKHIKLENGIEYLQFKKLLEYKQHVVHGIFLRHGGASVGEYATLNVRLPNDVADNAEKENVLKNVNKICTTLKIDINKLYKGRQSHTNNVLDITEEVLEQYKYEYLTDELTDGYIHSLSNTASLVMTADCIPVILYDTKNNVLCNIHCGWKGVLNNIVSEAIELMCNKYECHAINILAFMGPSIRECCFTTKDVTFVKKFEKTAGECKYWYKEDEKYHISLQKILKNELVIDGIKQENIYDSNICTTCNNMDFFSYRKAVIKGVGDYGCFASIVGLR